MYIVVPFYEHGLGKNFCPALKNLLRNDEDDKEVSLLLLLLLLLLGQKAAQQHLLVIINVAFASLNGIYILKSVPQRTVIKFSQLKMTPTTILIISQAILFPIC